MAKVKADMHVHTEYSFDSKVRIKDYIEEAEKQGLNYLAFTDHVEFSNQPVNEVLHRISMRNEQISKLQDTTKIKLIKGIEVSEPHIYQKELDILYDKLLDLDYVIGSIHHIKCMSLKKMVNNKNAMKIYYRDMLEMVLTSRIQTVAHLDYIKRYISSGDVDIELLKEILEVIKDRELALEINSSGIERCGEPFPNANILELYKVIGARKVVIGSDSHSIGQLYRDVEGIDNIINKKGFEKGIVLKKSFRRI